MTDATTKTAPAPDTTVRGFSLPCLHCPEVDTVSINLGELTGDEALYCSACESRYGLDEVRDTLAAWAKVLDWVALAPKLPE